MRLRASGGSEEEIIRETMSAKRAKMRADIAHELRGQTDRVFEAQAFAIGDDIALVGIPGEPFVEIGLQVKESSPFEHTLFCGYTNVGWAYIPMPDAYPLGGYEVEITPFGPEAAGQVVSDNLALLHQLAGS